VQNGASRHAATSCSRSSVSPAFFPPATPAGFFGVTAYSRTHSRCEWKDLATYNTFDEKNKQAEIGGGGKALITEGVPRHPLQQWVMDPYEGKVIECNSNPQGSAYCGS
jgi:hypothetical protein